jgi:hypothetical protein
VTFAIEFNHAVALRIFNRIGEYGCALLELRRRLKLAGKTMAVEDVVAENERAAVGFDKFAYYFK